jgi:hypothetical protein
MKEASLLPAQSFKIFPVPDPYHGGISVFVLTDPHRYEIL